jgi:aerobic-type carbon monoxide dehydrogenase small subunit (CoxS/CutS family)
VPGNLIKLRFTLNERSAILQCHPGTRLLDILRDDFGLKGTREGCARGECGACLVLMNGLPVNSCLIPAFTLSDAEILTIEGIHSLKSLADIRKFLPENDTFRCGFCSSGIRVSLTALMLVNPDPDEEEIRQALSGNLCACGNYGGVVAEIIERNSRKRKYARKRSERS